jgi:hypothetical protein
MTDVLVRDVDPKILEGLKRLAGKHGRSLQEELMFLLERAACETTSDTQEVLAKWETRFAGRRFSSNAELIREDRKR